MRINYESAYNHAILEFCEAQEKEGGQKQAEQRIKHKVFFERSFFFIFNI